MADLSSDQWKRIDTLFEAALAQPPDQQETFLRRACGGDAALYEEVCALLEDAAEADRLFGESVTDFAAPLLPELEAELARAPGEAPTEVGPYRILGELGRGGMGTVYLAERADASYRQQVALKLVKRGMDSDEILRRFRYERQILASLQHPNIARLLDGGMTADGRPYLVMEHVEGERIDAYCDRKRLTVEERLRLFEGVGAAVQYAHQKLVVHRDLKPSNILVTEDGTVKLLDFGIAKLLTDDGVAADGSVTVPLTRTGMRVLTPEYASPEQVRGEGVTTASDVYALGVVLYELLTGHRPYDVEPGSVVTTEQAVLTQAPTRPSTAVGKVERATGDGAGTRTPRTPDAISAARRTTPERLRRRLQGDLDTMVLMALRKEATRRYASAEAFVEDIRRHLAGLPVQAQRDTWGYRARKFVQRHAAGVAVAGVALVLITGLTVFYTVRVTQERNRAELEARKAQAATAFMERLFDGADPDETLGDTLTVFQILDRGAAMIEGEFADQPAVRADLQDRLGLLYGKLGAYDQAEALLREALAERRRLFAAPHAEVAQSLSHLAQLNGKRGRFAASDSLFQLALAQHRALYGGDDRRVALLLNDYGYMLAYSGRYDEAEPLVQEALALLEQQPADERAAIATSWFALAHIRMNEAEYAEAEALYRQVLATRRALYGDVHREVADALNDLGNLLVDEQRYDEAEPLLQEALAIRRQLVGDDHPDVSQALNNLAFIPYSRGDYAEAEAIFRESLAIVERLVGRTNRDYGMTLNNIGYVVMLQGDHARAEAVFREALGIMRQASGVISPDAGLLLGNVATALHRQGKLAEAEAFYREALAVREAVHGPENMHVAWRQFALAEVLREQGKYAEAEALHRTSVALRRQLREPGHFDVGRGLNGLGRTLVEQGRYAEAEPVLREAVAILEDLAHPNLAISQHWLGACLTGLGRYDEAEALLLASHEALPEDAAVRGHLAALYAAWGKPEQARAYR